MSQNVELDAIIIVVHKDSDITRCIETTDEEEKEQFSQELDEIKPENDENSLRFHITKGIQLYLMKMKGIKNKKPPPRETVKDMLASMIVCFIGILLVSVINYWYLRETFITPAGTPVVMLIGSVIVFDAYSSPLAQPKNVMLSHILASFISISIRLFGDAINMDIAFQAALSVSFAVAAMRIFRCTHPPGGAVALIGIIGGPEIWNMGFGYMLTCIGWAFICIAVGLLFNNLFPWRRYPGIGIDTLT